MEIAPFIKDLKRLRQNDVPEFERDKQLLACALSLTQAKAGLIFMLHDEDGLTVSQNQGVAEATRLHDLVQRALDQGHAFEKFEGLLSGSARCLAVAVRLDASNPMAACILCPQPHSLNVAEILLRLQMISDLPGSAASTRRSEGVSLEQDIILTLMASLSPIEDFAHACITLVNEISTRFRFARVSLGWIEDGFATPVSISHVDKFNLSTDRITNLQAVMEECYDQNAELLWPAPENSQLVLASHEQYARTSGLSQILSLPLRNQQSAVAIVTIESLSPLSLREQMALRLLLNLVTPQLLRIRGLSRPLILRLKDSLRRMMAFWLGPEYTFRKLLAIAGVVLLGFICFGSKDFHIEADASLVTDQTSYVSAPFDGIVEAISAKAGDFVTKGQILLEFDSQELLLKMVENEAEISRYEREAQKSRADGRLADMNIAAARLKQAQAELLRIQHYVALAKMKAPRAGMIIEGDTKNLLGAPLNKGTVVFQITDPVDLYLEIKVPQEAISEIQAGQSGELALISNPSQKIPFTVDRILPVARVEGLEGNHFVVHASFLNPDPDWFRPGMKGTARILVGQRNILWILSHRLQDLLHIYLWL